eukprot:scaffold504_cov109-Cylindrotheca_fusiformis.AAC.2
MAMFRLPAVFLCILTQLTEYGDLHSAKDRVVLFLHGFPDLSSSWKFQAERLAENGYFVIAPDLRGYGSSSIPKGVSAYGKEQLVSDIDALRRHYCGDNGSFAMIAGHDWGGFIVWVALETFGTGGNGDELSSHQIARCAALLNGPHPATLGKAVYTLSQFLKSWYMFWFQVPVIPETLLSRSGSLYNVSGVEKKHPVLSRGMHGDDTDNATCSATPEEIDADLATYKAFATDYDRVQAALSYYRAMGAGLWSSSEKRSIVTWLMSHIHGVSYDASKRSSSQATDASIKVPTMILWGSLDPHLGQEVAYPPAGKVENLEGPIFLDAGHWVHWEKPVETTEKLLAFANKHN